MEIHLTCVQFIFSSCFSPYFLLSNKEWRIWGIDLKMPKLWVNMMEFRKDWYILRNVDETGILTMRHSLIRGVLIQSCSARAKNFTNYVFCHPQFSGVIQNIENCCANLTLFIYVDYYQNNQFYKVKIELLKFCFIGTIIFGTLAWTIEFYMTKYIIGEISSSSGATLYKLIKLWYCI